MKRIILAFLFVVPAALGWATDYYYIVGDATPWSWVTGSDRNNTKMTETSSDSGIYVWTGLLKHGGDGSGNGFIICKELTNWLCYGASKNQTTIADTGSDIYTSNDNKWNPTNTDWQYYTITLNTNTGRVSWEAGKSFVPDGEGFYNIADGTDLYWFSVLVEKVNQSAKAKLTADIDYSAYPKGFIGTSSNNYAGTFDGQEHIITLALESDTQISGLFAYINGATIKNLVVDGSITSSVRNIGGLGGQVNGSSTIENIVVDTSINFTPGSGDASIGGFFPYVHTSSSLTLTNCAFYGSINANTATGNAGLVSWNSGTINATNCLIAPENVTPSAFEDYTRGNDPTTSNCFKVAGNDARLASGELCYTMNGDQSEINWYQNIGTEKPVPFSTHQSVHQASPSGYTNLTVVDSKTQIGTSADLSQFAAEVNVGNTAMDAKLTDDIDYTAYPKGFIGTNSKRFAGTFDGQEHTITIDINNNATCTGLFGVIEGATIKNLIVEGNAESSAKLLGGLGGVSYGICTIENIVVKTAIKFTGSGDATLGGIFGDMEAASIVKNCAFYGSVDAPKGDNIRGLASWCSNNPQFVNCIIAPTEIIANSSSDFANGSYTNTKCVKVAANDARLASGELCYTMNGSTCYNPDWTQTIGTDSHPVPFATRGIVNKISSVGYTTQYIPSTDVTIPDGVEAYAGVINGEWLSLKEIESSISKNDAVILKGSEGYYSFTPTTGASSASSNNLKGSDGSVEGDGSSIYALANLGDPAVVGFYLVNDGVPVPAGKAYLNLSGSSVKGFTFLFDDDATSIEMVNGQSSMVNGQPIYNLAGQRLNKMQQGINIINGKKILK